jgi:tetraacyldisaccharide 4'-kinase
MESNNKAIITTEKDAMRLEQHADFLRENKLPIFILPAMVEFHFGEGEELINRIKEFLLAFKV